MTSASGDGEQRISHYRVLGALGAGGMGDVYAGFDETLNRRVALKSIRAAYRLNAESKVRFLREARLLSQLDHPNVCRIYDYLEEDGADWLVLELIDGRHLRDAVAAGLEVRQRLRIAEQIAAVLVATHTAGVVHRDLKPSNVMVTHGGAVKVLDFGLAHSIVAPDAPSAVAPAAGAALPDDEAADAVDATRTAAGDALVPQVSDALGAVTEFHTRVGAISGTVAYMSPEQAAGRAATTASDMYSFGLLLQELFTGTPPYDRTVSPAELLERVRAGESLPATGIDRDLAALIARLKSFAPSQRPTAVDAAERLKWIREKPARRLRRLAAAGVAAALILAAMKYTYDLARERTIAVAARADADARRRQAETLIGFMLGDLRGKLQQVGRLELLEDVGREATAYFKAVPPATLSGEELYRRSQAVYQIGQIQQAKGNLAAAIQSYRESLALIEQVAARDPQNAKWQLGLGTAHFYVGDALRIQGDLNGALEHFQAYWRIAERLHAQDPRNAEWTLEASFGHSNVASVLEAKGELGAALAELDKSRALKQEAVSVQPENIEWQRTLASGHNRIGVVLHKMGELARAREHYEQDLAIEEALLRRQPGNARLELAVSVAHSWVGTVLDDMGEVTGAAAHHRARFDMTTRLVERDAANAEWQREHASARMWLADLSRYHGDLTAAGPLYQQSLATLTALLEKSPNSGPLRRDVGRAHARVARLLLADGHAAAAMAEATAGLAVLAPALAKNLRDRDALRASVDCELLLGTAAAASGRRDEASAHWGRALAAIEPIARASDDPAYLGLWARALRQTGRGPEAAQVAERLAARGYRSPDFTADWRGKGEIAARK